MKGSGFDIQPLKVREGNRGKHIFVEVPEWRDGALAGTLQNLIRSRPGAPLVNFEEPALNSASESSQLVQTASEEEYRAKLDKR